MCTNPLLALLRPFVDICLFRKGPQDLPASGLLLVIALASYAFLSTLWGTLHYGPAVALLVGMVQTGLVSALVAVVLWVYGVPGRLPQTLTAMTGTGTVLNALALPLSVAIVAGRGSAGDAGGMQLVWFALLLWSWSISAHIFRHALSVRFGTALALSIAMFAISIAVMKTLFPDPASDAAGEALNEALR